MRDLSDPPTAFTSRALFEQASAHSQLTRGRRIRATFGWASLTPREREVAQLVAEGSTNPEIGRELFMSVNTVKTHLGHAYMKLDISSRAQLAALITRIEHSNGSHSKGAFVTSCSSLRLIGGAHNEHFTTRFAQRD